MSRRFGLLRWLALGLLAFAVQAQAAGKRLVILDDDVPSLGLAQFMAVLAPDVEVLGVTIVSGSTWRDENVAHMLRMLEIVGRADIPVMAGAELPLLNTETETERWEALYGKLIWKGAWMKRWVEDTVQTAPNYHAPDVVPPLAEGMPAIKASAENAVDFLVRKVREFPGQVSIVATGPMTNIALAQQRDPQFAALAKELVYMGGSLNPQRRLDTVSARQFAREFVNTPRREFNFRWDPEAARIALRAPWRKIVMVPVDPSTATELSADLMRRMTARDTVLARQLKARKELGFPLWDEIAAAVWLDPSLIAAADELYIDVNTQFGPGYGDTLSWAPHYQPGVGERIETVVREVDVPRLERLMVELMTRPLPSSAH
ncbi:nucleoside hydrolase [Solimonas variicoloris]|uniref:nucleoside hydrolase n=1 Tax=Solimonas variicoloris TaxID=254408 RepID=UPI00035F57EB|nr:nucleoside hydrolase [Solimonas variicoloris]